MKKLIETVKKAGEDAIDFAVDLDLTSTPTSRAGHTIERVGKMDEAEVDHEVIALQLTKNSRKGNQYEADEIPTLVKVYQDTHSAVGVTSAQTRALIRDQQVESGQESDEANGALPA
ncbi:hypothetical protein [Pseudomonas kribbensis]|uniref:hypothetical protein n=1 Tax=Pseudomonas kribbensis TaxID=1628086 RepID=UPI001ABF4A41|nr:hypothetical protein [Pseudomonas kribbensis]